MIWRQTGKGFTIVELLIIVTILGLLASIAYFSIGDWRRRAATNEVKSDLHNAAAVLDNLRNFQNEYPSDLEESDFKPTSTVELDYTRRGDGSYCLNGWSSVRGDVEWYIDSRTSKEPAEGTCS